MKMVGVKVRSEFFSRGHVGLASYRFLAMENDHGS